MKQIMEAIEEMFRELGYGSKRIERQIGNSFIKVYRVNLSNTTKKLVRVDILYEDKVQAHD